MEGQRSTDKLKIPVTRLNKIPYVHGGYASVAPFMLNEKKWMSILKHLMPDAYQDLISLLKCIDSDSPPLSKDESLKSLKIMKWAENNPIVSAFGVFNSKLGKSDDGVDCSKWDRYASNQRFGFHLRDMKQSIKINARDRSSAKAPKYHVPAIEWDVFLDPSLVRNVDKAMQQVENLSSLGDDEITIPANVEVDRQVSRLISRMMLAHGSTTQLVAEAFGMAPRYNFSRVVKDGESMKRRIKKPWSFFSLCNGDSEIDATLDETYILHSNSFNKASSARQKSPIRTKSKYKSSSHANTGGLFAERWLQLFASALELGIQSEQSIHDLLDSGGYKIRKKTVTLERSRKQNAPSYRENKLECDNNYRKYEETFPDVDVLFEDVNEDLLPIAPDCSLFLCLGAQDPGATMADHGKSTMADSTKRIRKLLGERLRLVLDLKSRNVPARVWGRLIENLTARGLLINGVGSFEIDELREIQNHTSISLTGMIFFHSAGDLQRACHANEVEHGDTVYFNAGSLLWKKPTIYEATGLNRCEDLSIIDCHSEEPIDQVNETEFQPYAFLKDEDQHHIFEKCIATVADYQKHFDLKIGVYVQEFAIGSNELDALVKLVNNHPSIYKLGMAFGGLNGFAIKDIKGDGFWNQRYVGRNWDATARPSTKMQLLSPEDHHLVQKAILAGSFGQVTTAHQFFDYERTCENPAV